MSFTIKNFSLTLGTALLCGAIGLASTDENATGHHDGHARHHRRWQRHERRIEHREFLRSFHSTDEQRAQALQAARSVQPAVEATRSEARKIVADARAANPTAASAAIRQTVLEQIKNLHESMRAQVEPSARALAATLTPEQRQKLQDFAMAHGTSFDENRFSARLGRLLARQRAVEFLERRLNR